MRAAQGEYELAWSGAMNWGCKEACGGLCLNARRTSRRPGRSPPLWTLAASGQVLTTNAK